ncbi:MAG: bifunctional diguanylate cyclase/phosphodiesterase [Rhodoferax sp.]
MPAAPLLPARRQWLLSLLVFLLGLVMALAWIVHSETQQRDKNKALAADTAADHAQSLQRGLERALAPTYAIAAMVRRGYASAQDFESLASEMLPFYPGIAALGLSPNGVICCVVPLQGNEKSIGFDQFASPTQAKEALLARDSGRLTLAGPMPLAQGGMGVVGRLPIFLDDKQGQAHFWGFTYVTLRFPQALESARLEQLREHGYAYELWRQLPDGGERQRIQAWAPQALKDPVERSLELPNGTWYLSVAPVRGWTDPAGRWIKGALALLLCALAAYIAWLLYAMRTRDAQLEALVAQRTREILQTQQQLQATVNAIPDPLFELDLDGRCHGMHTPHHALLNVPTQNLLGHKVHDVLPAPAAQAVARALQEAHAQAWSTGVQFCLEQGAQARWFELSVARKPTPPDEIARFVVLARDITESRLAQEHIRQLAHYDALTGLPNRSLLADRCGTALSAAQRHHQPVALLFLDLDHFKHVNDSLGHRVGDQLLQQLARRIQAALREQDTVSRVGGDEFVIVLPDTPATGAAHVAQKLLNTCDSAFVVEGRELNVTPSMGVAMFPEDGTDFDTLSRCADAAMYHAKQKGRNAFHFYTAELQARSERTLVLENALRRALQGQQFSLHYQPLVQTHSGAVTGVEALLRWTHPQLGTVSPAEFIPIAEGNGLILPLGEWVLATAAAQLKQWHDSGLRHLSMAVNISAVQFRQADFPQRVGHILRQTQVDPAQMVLELTEGVALHDPHSAIATMDRLNQHGLALSIDDFGTGYSSLNYLKRFKASKLKIDKSFVRDIVEDPEDRAIVDAIIAMANSLGLHTVAEGVETAEQLALLARKGCTEVQGFFFSRPLDAPACTRFLQARALAC